jgi:hypothetical protein
MRAHVHARGRTRRSPQTSSWHRRRDQPISSGPSLDSRDRRARNITERKREHSAPPPSSHGQQLPPTRARRDGSVDRDRLLQQLFPKGIPAKEDIIRAINGWLDEAERLAKMK